MTPRPPPRLGSRPRTDPALTLAKLRDVVGAHTGIVTHLTRWRILQPAQRNVHGFGASLETATMLGDGFLRARRGEAEEIWRSGRQGRDGHRVAPDRTRAFVRAIGEALERYACGIYDPGELTTARWSDVKDRALDPRTLQRPTRDEYARFPGLAPFEPDATYRFAEGWSLRDRRMLLVHAQLCWVTYNPLVGEPRFVGPTSTGWAIHHTPEEAIHTALREVVERDSFILTWLHRLPVPRLDLASIDDAEVARALRDVEADGSLVRVLVTTTDLGIPSFAVAIADRRAGKPAFQLTTGAHPDAGKALRQAVEEAMMVRLDVALRLRMGALDMPAQMEDIQNMSHHADFYLQQANLGPLEWMLADGPHPSVRLEELRGAAFDDAWREVEWMVDRIAAAGLDTLYVDSTPPDLAEAGWCAAKVLVPGALRHEYGYGFRSLDCPRIFEAPVRMGHRTSPATLADINKDAHPYA